MKYFVKIIFFCLLIFVCTNCKNCDLIEFGDVLTIPQLKSCFNSVPFNSEIRDKTLDNVMFWYNDVYVFRDIQVNSGPPFNMDQGDVVDAELESYKTKSYNSDFEFQNDVRSSFAKLKDMHTLYMMPACYVSFVINLPFNIYGVVNSADPDKLDIYMQRSLNYLYYKSAFPEDDNDWNRLGLEDLLYMKDGVKITHIEGMDAYDWILNEANTNSIFGKDLDVRFNSIFRFFSEKQIPMFGLPTKDNITITIENKGDATIGYFARSMISAKNMGGFEKICGFKTNRRSDEEPYVDEEAIEFFNKYKGSNVLQYLQEKSRKLKEFDEERRSIEKVEADYEKHGYVKYDVPAMNPLYMNAYTTSKDGGKPEELVILEVGSFMNMLPIDHITYLAALFKKMKEDEKTKLIIDVRGNLGGNAGLPGMLLRQISKYSPQDFFDVLDLKAGEFETKAKDCPKMVASQLEKRKLDRTFYRDYDELFPGGGVEHTRGGKTSKYSSPYSFEFSTVNDLAFLAFIPLEYENNLIDIEPESLVVLTDGICASACGIFVDYVMKSKTGKVLNLGGRPTSSSMSSSIVHGSLMFASNVMEQTAFALYKSICRDYERYDKVMPSSAFLSLAYAERYEYPSYESLFKNEKIVVSGSTVYEFIADPGDFNEKLYNFDPKFKWQGWDAAVAVLPRCAKWWIEEDKSCTKTDPKGIYGRKCDNPPNDCELAYCEMGYFVDNDKCEEMPVRLWRMYDQMISGLITVICVVVGIIVCCCCTYILCYTLICVFICVYSAKKKNKWKDYPTGTVQLNDSKELKEEEKEEEKKKETSIDKI